MKQIELQVQYMYMYYIWVITDDGFRVCAMLVYCRKKSMLRWKNVKVGDVLRLEKDDFITVSENYTSIWRCCPIAVYHVLLMYWHNHTCSLTSKEKLVQYTTWILHIQVHVISRYYPISAFLKCQPTHETAMYMYIMQHNKWTVVRTFTSTALAATELGPPYAERSWDAHSAVAFWGWPVACALKSASEVMITVLCIPDMPLPTVL